MSPIGWPLVLRLPDEAATRRLGEAIAGALYRGDVVRLEGGLGAGKTTLARAVLRARAGDEGLEVPSPTFTLVQTYTMPELTLAHFDLYRLTDPDELAEIGFDDAVATSAVLVEWPERGGEAIPGGLTVALSIAEGERLAWLGGLAAWPRRLAPALRSAGFLD